VELRLQTSRGVVFTIGSITGYGATSLRVDLSEFRDATGDGLPGNFELWLWRCRDDDLQSATRAGGVIRCWVSSEARLVRVED
jgi:hypothetical protein